MAPATQDLDLEDRHLAHRACQSNTSHEIAQPHLLDVLVRINRHDPFPKHGCRLAGVCHDCWVERRVVHKAADLQGRKAKTDLFRERAKKDA